jgi:hypothetical protein
MWGRGPALYKQNYKKKKKKKIIIIWKTPDTALYSDYDVFGKMKKRGSR